MIAMIIDVPAWYSIAGLIVTGLVCVMCFAAGFCKGLERGNQITQRKRRFNSAEDY